MSVRLFLDPFDTFLIRDGRPFNQDDAGRAKAAGIFPPPPDTLYGATRVALARSHGWGGAGDWKKSSVPAEMFGDWSDPGTLSMAGPFFTANGEALLPIPANVYARVNKKQREVDEIFALRVSKDVLTSDVNGLRFLEMPPFDPNIKDEPLAGRFGRAGAVRKILQGKAVDFDELGPSRKASSSPSKSSLLVNESVRLPGWGVGDLVARETRIGIARDTATRLATDGMLYASVRFQLKQGIRLYVEVEGATVGSLGLPAGVGFGGEARFANPQNDGTDTILSAAPVTSSKFFVYLATPLMLAPGNGGTAIWSRISGLSGKVVAAAVPGISTTAGFGANDPNARLARPIIPAGSVLFVEGDPGAIGPVLGCLDKRPMGYGRTLKGIWNDG